MANSSEDEEKSFWCDIKDYAGCGCCSGMYTDVMKAKFDAFVQAIRSEERERAFEEAAKFLEENGWNDAIPIEVNMKEVAFRYARCIRGLAIRKGEA